MAAPVPLVPPPNLAGVAVPPPPQNADIAPAIDYVRQLNDGNFVGHDPATAHEAGLAECYKTALVFSATAPGQDGGAAGAAGAVAAPPQWLQANLDQQFVNVNLQLANIANDIAAIRAEQPILLANSQAGDHEPLYDPTRTLAGWVLLAFPHPTTRDELLTFTQAQCIASADALGLPPLPLMTPVATHRKQIANKLGVRL